MREIPTPEREMGGMTGVGGVTADIRPASYLYGVAPGEIILPSVIADVLPFVAGGLLPSGFWDSNSGKSRPSFQDKYA